MLYKFFNNDYSFKKCFLWISQTWVIWVQCSDINIWMDKCSNLAKKWMVTKGQTSLETGRWSQLGSAFTTISFGRFGFYTMLIFFFFSHDQSNFGQFDNRNKFCHFLLLSSFKIKFHESLIGNFYAFEFYPVALRTAATLPCLVEKNTTWISILITKTHKQIA
jgi:hypothetical protein